MKEIREFILEKFKINTDTVIDKMTDIPTDYSKYKGSNPQINKEERIKIEEFADTLPIKPKLIRDNINGGIVLYWAECKWYGGKHIQLSIIKSSKWRGGYKISWERGDYRPYEFPMGNTDKDLLKPNGSPLLETLDEVFDKILQQWQKKDFSKFLLENTDYKKED